MNLSGVEEEERRRRRTRTRTRTITRTRRKKEKKKRRSDKKHGKKIDEGGNSHVLCLSARTKCRKQRFEQKPSE